MRKTSLYSECEVVGLLKRCVLVPSVRWYSKLQTARRWRKTDARSCPVAGLTMEPRCTTFRSLWTRPWPCGVLDKCPPVRVGGPWVLPLGLWTVVHITPCFINGPGRCILHRRNSHGLPKDPVVCTVFLVPSRMPGFP